MAAYYNECDLQKAAWLRELIKAGVIAPGDVDERSIKDVRPDDLVGYAQCHFFAGIGVWSYALRLAGWSDDKPVWTGSCPCPSFSCAGKGGGFDDPRHLWPDWFRLIEVCRPATLFGEQSDDAIGYGWLDLVQTQMETADYAVGKAVLASASVGGSDLRERLYFVAHANDSRLQVRWTEISGPRECGRDAYLGSATPELRSTGELGDTKGHGRTGGVGRQRQRAAGMFTWTSRHGWLTGRRPERTTRRSADK